jgi:hypothetical protein
MKPFQLNPSPVMRPGSQDAFTKPSMVNGIAVPYKPPSNGCVGILKDRTSHSGMYEANKGLR